MTFAPTKFRLPAVLENASGATRTIGFELEFSGIKLGDTVNTVCAALDGRVTEQTAAEICVKADSGDFNVEVDWDFLKRTAVFAEQTDIPDSWLEQLSESAALLVPSRWFARPYP